MVVDFKRQPPFFVSQLYIDGAATGRIDMEYLSEPFLLGELRNMDRNDQMFQSCCRCYIESVLTFSFISWFGGLSVKNKSKCNKAVNVCSKTAGDQCAV